MTSSNPSRWRVSCWPSGRMNKMLRLLIALGWMVAAEAIWAAALILAAIFIVPKPWLADTFLDPIYLSQSSQVIESSTNDMVAAFVAVGLAIFGVSVICCMI